MLTVSLNSRPPPKREREIIVRGTNRLLSVDMAPTALNTKHITALNKRTDTQTARRSHKPPKKITFGRGGGVNGETENKQQDGYLTGL
jgi:hypothetical protein